MLRLPDKITPDWPGWFGILFLTNLVVKAFPIFQGVMIHPDAPVYLWAAQSLDQGNIQEAIRAYPMLFYPFLVMCVHKLGFDWLTAGRIISTVSSCLALFPFFSLARRFLPAWPSYFVSLLFIFLPQYNSIAFAAIRDPLYICLGLYCLHFAINFMEQPGVKKLLLVMFFSLSLPLLRVEGTLVFLVIWGWLFFISIRRLDLSKRIWTILSAVAVLCAVFSVLQASDTGKQILRMPDMVQYVDHIVSDNKISVDRYLAKLDDLAKHHRVSGHANNLWQVMQRHLILVFAIGMIYMFVELIGWPLILLGFFGQRGIVRSGTIGWLLIVLFTSCQLLILAKYMITGSMEERIMLFPAILWLIFAGAALYPVADWMTLKLAHHRFRNATIIALICALILLPFAYKTVTQKFRIHIPVIRSSCLWLKEHLLSNNKEWQVRVPVRRMQWFLDKKDAQLTGKKNICQIRKFLQKGPGAKMVVLLLKNRKEEEKALAEELANENIFLTKIFNDIPNSKYFVVACWKES